MTRDQYEAAVALAAALQREPYRYDFFQALRRLECLHRRSPRLGESVRPADDPVRLGQEPSLTFAPRTLASFTPGKNGGPPRLDTFFFGLFGPGGPLPSHLTEYARDRIRNNGDPTFSRFVDLFHHRLLCLFYRAWADAQPTVCFDRPESDRFATFVGSLFGIGMESFRDRDAMPDLAKLHFAGRFVAQARNAEGLQAILRHFFQIPAQIDEFVGHWLELPENCRCRLGETEETGTLGLTATIGARVWDCQSKFRVVLGPMRLSEYRRLLPGGESLERLTAIVRNYVGNALLWDVQLILKKEEVPAIQLGRAGELGHTTWLVSQTPPRDARDLTLRCGV